MDRPLVEVTDLVVTYPARRGRTVRAVDGVSLRIERGQTVGLVGESGSGKSTIGSVLLGLVEPESGTVRFDGGPVHRGTRAERASLARRIQVVFQDPFGSMNPARRVGESLAEAPRYTLGLPREQVRERLVRALEDVGMRPDALDRYPSQFSGGQLQRLAIARALAMEPEFIVCDEAVSALDLSVQAQVINLLGRLARERDLAYLFISHDLSVVRHVSDRIVVLFAGQVLESGPAELVYGDPAHPYTRTLVLAAPVPDPDQQSRRRALRLASSARAEGGPPSGGCPFTHRCEYAVADCARERPELIEREDGRSVACHRYADIAVEEVLGA